MGSERAAGKGERVSDFAAHIFLLLLFQGRRARDDQLQFYATHVSTLVHFFAIVICCFLCSYDFAIYRFVPLLDAMSETLRESKNRAHSKLIKRMAELMEQLAHLDMSMGRGIEREHDVHLLPLCAADFDFFAVGVNSICPSCWTTATSYS